MTYRVEMSYLLDGDYAEIEFHFGREISNIMDYCNMFDPHVMANILYHGTKKIQSNGLQGVVAEDVPTSATVILIQEHQGHYIEVGRMISADGAWNIAQLQDTPTHAIALKDGFNAGITANITPED